LSATIKLPERECSSAQAKYAGLFSFSTFVTSA
jgi:hypothetical protein